MRLDSLDLERTEAVQKRMDGSKSCLGGNLGADRGRQEGALEEEVQRGL